MSIQHVGEPQSALTISAGDEVNPVLEHILDCPTCLKVITDLHLPVSLCEEICPEYHALIVDTIGISAEKNPTAALARL